MAKPHADVEPIKTLDELAKLVGRNKGTVSRWLNRPDWPFGRPTWARSKVPDILRWAAEHLRDRSDVQSIGTPAAATPAVATNSEAEPAPTLAPVPDIASLKKKKLAAEVRKLEAQADQAQTALARERGDLLDAEEVEERFAAVGVAIRNGFERLPSQLVGYAKTHGMPQAGVNAFRGQIEAAVASVLRKLSDHGWAAEDDDEGGT